MITPDIILQPFAANAGAQDITTPPQTSATGFVNFSDGYTRFYEINLAANNPQAKAVERQIMNYMFKELTKNAQAWQSQGYAAWYSTKAGGYERGAYVMRVNGGVMTPYRSLIDANVSDPLSTPAQWEYQPTAAEAKLNVPMPHGGGTGPTAAIIRSAIDLNTLTSGTFEVQTDATAALCTNMPAMPGQTAKACLIESITWTDAVSAGNTIKLQRVTDTAGNIFIRSAVNAAHSLWTIHGNAAYTQAGTNFYGVTTGTGAAYAMSLNPTPGALTDGMEVRVKWHVLGTGAATFNLNGLGAKQLVGTSYAAIKAGTIQVGAVSTLVYQSSTDCWVIKSLVGGYSQGLPARNDDEVPNYGQTKTYADSAATAQIASNNTYLQSGALFWGVTGGTGLAFTLALNPAITVLTDGMEIRARMHTASTGAATLNVNGLGAKAILGFGYLPIQAGTLAASSEVTFRYRAANNYWIAIAVSGGRNQTAAAVNNDEVVNYGQMQSYVTAAIPTTMPWANITGKPDIVINGASATLFTLELMASTPFIDWHYNSDASDYNVRIINDANLTLSFYTKSSATPVFQFNSNGANFSKVVQFNGGSTTPFGQVIQWLDNTGLFAYYTTHDNNFWYLNVNTGPNQYTVLTVVRATRQVQFTLRPSFAGATPWDTSNFTPSNYILNGRNTETALLTLCHQNGSPISSMPAGDNSSLYISNNGNGSAAITFIRDGLYAGYFGLSTDNNLWWGGYSAGAGGMIVRSDNMSFWMQSMYGSFQVYYIGAYAMAYAIDGVARSVGDLVASSTLRYVSANGQNAGIAPAAGTWRCMGYSGSSNNLNSITLWQRVA